VGSRTQLVLEGPPPPKALITIKTNEYKQVKVPRNAASPGVESHELNLPGKRRFRTPAEDQLHGVKRNPKLNSKDKPGNGSFGN
jgi:hypothetical protein